MKRSSTHTDEHLRGVLDPDFLALGLGGTNMMSMLWTVAMGRRAVGVEMRGDPFLGVHWNIRVDLYHQLGLIDQMMLDRYGEAGVPRREDGSLFKLAELFYSTRTVAGDIVADEIIDGYDMHQHIVGTIHHVEFIDDRWRDGVPNRVVTLLHPPKPPDQPDPSKIRTDVIEVLDGPSTFQAGAASVLILLRRYLERIEQQDIDEGRDPPRVRLFTRHRVVPAEGDGFIHTDDGRKRIRIEALQEFDFKGKFVRVRAPASQVIDIGVPELFMIAQGFHSTDAERLGFQQEDVKVDHQDGRGPVVAQADFLAGLIEVLVGGRLRRRISSEFDAEGREYWVRQIAVGHENDPEVGWVLVQVPDFKTFDPVEAGLVPAGTDPASPEFFAAYQHLVYEYYMEQSADILELPKESLKGVQMVYGPKLFSLIERVGDDARIAKNGVVAGDSFGNGHFLTSGGAMTGMVGHSSRVLRYWQTRDQGASPEEAIVPLAEGIKQDTHGWLHVSAQEYSEAVPINFGIERILQISAASGIDPGARAHAIDATRRRRHSLLPLDPSDWRRLFLRNGRVHSAPLPELHAMHPALRAQRRPRRGARVSVAVVVPHLRAEALRFLQATLGQPGVRVGLVSEDPLESLPESLRDRLAAHWRVASAQDASELADAVTRMSPALGRPDLLLGTSEEVQVVLALVRDALGIAGMGASAARNFRDKARAKALLAQAGLPVARHRLVESAEAAVAFGREVGYPLVVKPPEGTGAAGVVRVESEPRLVSLLGRLGVGAGRPVLCEEQVEGQEGSLDVVCIGGLPAWFSATRWHPAPLTVLENPWIQWTVVLPREIDDPLDAATRRMGFAALKALGMGTGLAHLEWFRRPDGSAVISEVAARPPGARIVSLMGHAHGADLYRAWANAVVHGLFAPIPRTHAAGAAYLRGQGRGDRVVGVRGLDEVRRELGELVVEVQPPLPGQPRVQGYEGEGYVIVRHPETAVVEQALKRIITNVRIELG